MNCDEFRAALLAGDESEHTRRHEEGCAACRSRSSDLRAAQGALADATVWEEPSPELGNQIENLISGAAGGPGRRIEKRRGSVARLAIAAVMVAAAITAGMIVVAQGAAPDWEVALPATEIAPEATGTVKGWNEESGTRMVVALDGLAPAPDGYLYEFWLSNGPIHISAGTFHSPGEIELWSGVSRADYPRLWITLEPIDDDESPTQQTVLDTGTAGV